MGPLKAVAAAVVSALFVSTAEAAKALDVPESWTLPFDHDGHLAKHVIIVSPACEGSTLANVWEELSARNQHLFDIVLGSYNIVTEGVSLPDERLVLLPSGDENEALSECSTLVYLEMGVNIEYAAYAFAYFNYETFRSNALSRQYTEVRSWMQEEVKKVELGLINAYDQNTREKLDFYWLNREGKEHYNGKIGYSEKKTAWIYTFLGDTFLVKTASGELVQEINIEKQSVFVIGISPTGIGKHHQGGVSIEEATASTYRSETRRSTKVRNTFTKKGYDKVTVPPRLFGLIQTYYRNNKGNNCTEEWYMDKTGVHVNWWDVDPLMIIPPPQTKGKWHQILKPVLERWIGGESLEPTDLYGIRMYQDKAWLISHVDREDTHAVSAILNLDQVNMREPWMLDVVDLDGKVNYVEMQPGELVLYESAKCMHGRQEALKGEMYANIFFHYRPTGDPKWWRIDASLQSRMLAKSSKGSVDEKIEDWRARAAAARSRKQGEL